MGSNASTGHEVDTSKDIDNKTLLQVNASMVVGTLFVLTLTTFVSVPEVASRPAIGLAALAIIIPFVISALLILRFFGGTIKRAKWLTGWGFMSFGMYLAAFAVFPIVPYLLVGNFEQQCATSLESFNVTTEPWKCSMFSPGSLADLCVRHPESLNVTKLDCADFIPPSS